MVVVLNKGDVMPLPDKHGDMRPIRNNKKKKKEVESFPSRMGAITAARKRGELKGMPINGAGIDYNKGNWIDNTGRTFGTAASEDSKITPVGLGTAIHIHLHNKEPDMQGDYRKIAKLARKRK